MLLEKNQSRKWEKVLLNYNTQEWKNLCKRSGIDKKKTQYYFTTGAVSMAMLFVLGLLSVIPPLHNHVPFSPDGGEHRGILNREIASAHYFPLSYDFENDFPSR